MRQLWWFSKIRKGKDGSGTTAGSLSTRGDIQIQAFPEEALLEEDTVLVKAVPEGGPLSEETVPEGECRDKKASAQASEKQVSEAQRRYLEQQRRSRRLVRTAQVLMFLFFLALWEVSVRLGWIDGFIFSSPSRMAATFQSMWADRSILRHTGMTVLETLISFGLVAAAGTGAAVLLWYKKELSQVLEPYLVVLNSLPKSALAPLLIVWLGANMKSIIVSGMSVALFGTILNLYTGFCETDPDKIRLIYTLGGTKRDVLTKVVLPGTLPLLLSVMKVDIGLCLVGVVIGEFIGAREGLGYLIIYGSQVFKLDWVILSIAILCIIAVVLYGILGFAEKLCRRRR